MASTTATASELARQTPATRDRYVDFLRLFSIATVVLGHWLIAVMRVNPLQLVVAAVVGGALVNYAARHAVV
jgi:hypothetical protein